MTKDEVTKALRQAYNLGQIYWQQADSEYISQHKKADQTEAKFQELLETTVAALEAKDEPVAWMYESVLGDDFGTPSYAKNIRPKSASWVGLTDEEIMEMLDYGQYGRVPQYARNFVDAIEAKLKEKNNA